MTLRKRALFLAALALVPAAGALAQEAPAAEAAPSAPASDGTDVTVAVEAPEAVDMEQLRERLARDLGASVRVVAGGEGRVILRVTSDGRLSLSMQREGMPPLTRETPLGRSREQTTVTAALIIANLVRDESGELIALLTIERPAPPTEPEPPIVVLAPETPQPPTTEPPVVAPAPPSEPRVRRGPEAPPWVPAGVDFAPGAGVSSAFLGRERRAFSFGAIGSWYAGFDAFALSGVTDLALGPSTGVQIGGVLSVAGPMEGLQIGGVAAASTGGFSGGQIGGVVAASVGDAEGFTLGGVTSVALGDVSGVQIAGVASIGDGRLSGLSLGGVLAYCPNDVEGVQIGGVVSASGGRLRGLSLGGVVSTAMGGGTGMQLATVNVAGGAFEGLQLGVLNVSDGPVDGMQLGVVNIATGPVRGLQLGVVNVSEDSDGSIGLLSVHERGRNQLRIGADTNGFFEASFINGGRITHSVLSVAVEPFLALPAVALGGGLGARIDIEGIVHLDLEALFRVMIDETIDQLPPDLLTEARLLVGIPIVPGIFGLYAGLAYRLYYAQRAAPELGSPLLEYDFGSGLRGWPSVLGGIELF